MTRKIRTVAPAVSDFLARLDGGTVTTTEVEHVHDHVLLPEVAPIPWETKTTTSITVPRMLLGLRCPGCDGVRDRSNPDPLALLHEDPRCEVAAAEEMTERRDLQILRRLVARGHEPRKHRLQTPTERLLLGHYHVVPPTQFTITTLTEDGRRARAWAELRQEPALAIG